MRAYVRHVRAAQLCTGGTREWFKQRDWSWPDFLANGRPAVDFLNSGDPLAVRVYHAAMEEAERG